MANVEDIARNGASGRLEALHLVLPIMRQVIVHGQPTSAD